MNRWIQTSLGKIIRLNYGKALPKKKRILGEIPVYGSNGIIGWHNQSLVKENGIIVGRKGTVGAVHLSSSPFFPIDTSYFVKEQDTDLDFNFLYYLLLHADLSRLVSDLVPGLNRDLAYAQIVPIPEEEKEQKIIAGVLSLVQNAIAQQEKAIALTTELKKALMQKLFTEGTRKEPQKQTEIGLIPESWDIVAWGKIAKIGNGATPKKSNVDYWKNGHIPWLTSTKIHDSIIVEPDQYVTPQAVKECHLPLVKANSLLVAITGQGKTLGNSALVTFDTRINQHLAYAQFNTTDIVPLFILAFMQGRYEHLRGIAKAGGSTKGALTCGFLKTYPIPVPKDKQEQELIAQIFNIVNKKIASNNAKIKILQDLFQTLLHQLMTAKIRVSELNLNSLNLELEE